MEDVLAELNYVKESKPGKAKQTQKKKEVEL